MAFALGSLSFLSTVSANCTSVASIDQDATGKYGKVYVQEPNNISNSWRLYIRPRNGACLTLSGNGFQSPTLTPGQTDGKAGSAGINPGSKNCNDDHKSYMAVDIPAAQAIYDTYTAAKIDTTTGLAVWPSQASKQQTMIGFNFDTTKNGGYSGVIYVAPMIKPDGSYDNQNAKVTGLCYK